MDNYFTTLFIVSIISGFITMAILKPIGYPRWKGYLPGFFLGVIGIFVALVMKSNQENSD